jgi:hypothetical protein
MDALISEAAKVAQLPSGGGLPGAFDGDEWSWVWREYIRGQSGYEVAVDLRVRVRCMSGTIIQGTVSALAWPVKLDLRAFSRVAVIPDPVIDWGMSDVQDEQKIHQSATILGKHLSWAWNKAYASAVDLDQFLEKTGPRSEESPSAVDSYSSNTPSAKREGASADAPSDWANDDLLESLARIPGIPSATISELLQMPAGTERSQILDDLLKSLRYDQSGSASYSDEKSSDLGSPHNVVDIGRWKKMRKLEVNSL